MTSRAPLEASRSLYRTWQFLKGAVSVLKNFICEQVRDLNERMVFPDILSAPHFNSK